MAQKKHGELDMIAEKQAAAYAARAAQSAKVRDKDFGLLREQWVSALR